MKHRYRPRAEASEQRRLLATLTVTSAAVTSAAVTSAAVTSAADSIEADGNLTLRSSVPSGVENHEPSIDESFRMFGEIPSVD